MTRAATATAGASPSTRVRDYEPGDERAIQEIFERVFGHPRPIEEWRWQFQEAPGGPALILLLEHEGTPVGHLAHLPFAVWMDGRRARLALGCDSMILPEHRGRGGVGGLVRGFLDGDHEFDIRMSFPTNRRVAQMVRHGVGVLLGRLPKWVHLIERPRELAAAGRFAAGPLVRLQGWLANRPAPRIDVRPLDELGPASDRLAAASASFAPCIRIRDASYLRWRWLDRPGTTWTILGAADEGELRGFAVIGVEDSPNGRRGRVADLLARDPEALRALLGESVRRLARAGCARVVCDYHDPRPWARRAFLTAGFLPLRGELKIVYRGLSARAKAVPEQLAAWYLTRGDSDLG